MRGNASLTAFICVVNELVVLLETSARRRLNSTKTCSGTTSSIDLATSISSTTFNKGAERWSSTMRNHQLVSIRSFFFRLMATTVYYFSVSDGGGKTDFQLDLRALAKPRARWDANPVKRCYNGASRGRRRSGS